MSSAERSPHPPCRPVYYYKPPREFAQYFEFKTNECLLKIINSNVSYKPIDISNKMDMFKLYTLQYYILPPFAKLELSRIL